MSALIAPPSRNRLLAALDPEDLERISRYAEPVDMPLGEVIHESGHLLEHMYFPTTCVVSLSQVLENGATTGIGLVGFEGLVGVALFMGGGTTISRAVVQSAGEAYRIADAALKVEFRRPSSLQPLLLRYTQALLTQMAQTAVCNRHHRVDQQLCRWLLLSLDRLASNELITTQELIAQALGVRREGVTEAARKLQDAGLIRHRRGHIEVLDRAGLEARCCECYAVVRREVSRLLPDPAQAAVDD